MDNVKFRCRKCRQILFSLSHLITAKAKSLESERDLEVDCPNMLWFIDLDSHPDWIASSLESSQFSKGKLCCERCEGRVGAFDFMSVIRCVCGKHNIPPIRVAKNRVDLCIPPELPQVLPQVPGDQPYDANRAPQGSTSGVGGPRDGNREFPLHTDSLDGWETSSMEVDAVLQRSIGNGSLQSDTAGAARNRRVPGSAPRSHSHRKVRSNRHNEEDSVITGDTDSDSGIQSRPASDSEGEGAQQAPSNSDGHDRLKHPENLPSNRFQQLQESGHNQETSEKENIENVGLAAVPGDLADFDGYTCPICLDVYFAPHTCHPCQHVFCAPCLRRLHASIPVHTKCPLCRQVICACIANHELNNRIKLNFPREYKARQSSEKKVKHRLPPLPSAQQLISFGRRGNSRSRNIILAHWAGVCFVVLLVMFAIAILATTVGMVLWYIWEISMDYFIELVVVVDDAFTSAWETVVLTLFEGGVSPQVAKVMMGSFGHVLHTFGKFFNKSLEKAAELAAEHGAVGKAKVQEGYQYLSSAMQADIANYILIMGIVTYLVYKFAKHRQATLEARGVAVH